MPIPIPSHDEVCVAFARIKREGGLMWDHEHPLRDFVLAAQNADITRSAERLAAYRQAGSPAPLGYYDDMLDMLHLAIERLERQRAIDHGDAPFTRCYGRQPYSAAMRGRVRDET